RRSGALCAGCFGNPMRMRWDRAIPEHLSIMMPQIFRMRAKELACSIAKEGAQFWPWRGTCSLLAAISFKKIPPPQADADPDPVERPISGGVLIAATGINSER